MLLYLLCWSTKLCVVLHGSTCTRQTSASLFKLSMAEADCDRARAVKSSSSRLQLHTTNFGQRFFTVSAPLSWNRLLQDIRNLQSLESFKSSSRLISSTTVTDTDKHGTDTDVVFADSSRPSNIVGFIINYGRPLSVSGRPCYILPMFFLNFFFMAALFSGPG